MNVYLQVTKTEFSTPNKSFLFSQCKSRIVISQSLESSKQWLGGYVARIQIRRTHVRVRWFSDLVRFILSLRGISMS